MSNPFINHIQSLKQQNYAYETYNGDNANGGGGPVVSKLIMVVAGMAILVIVSIVIWILGVLL